MTFNKISIESLNFNPFTKIGQEWSLITAGESKEKCNTMTASWGSLGVQWRKNTATVFIAPSRYTKEFVDNQTYFTLSFFEQSFREKLDYLGNVSGRDEPKIAKAELTPIEIDGTVGFSEAEMIFVVKKLYHGQLSSEEFIGSELVDEFYQDGGFHEIFTGEIVAVYQKN